MNEKKSKSRTQKFLEKSFNFRAWSDWDRTKLGGEFISESVSQVVEPKKAKLIESFDEAKKRMKLTDEALASRGRALWRLSILMTAIGAFIFCYAIYHFMYGTVHAGIFALALMSLSLVYALRYHFWYFQIKTRRLGCTLKEWFQQGLLGKKS